MSAAELNTDVSAVGAGDANNNVQSADSILIPAAAGESECGNINIQLVDSIPTCANGQSIVSVCASRESLSHIVPPNLLAQVEGDEIVLFLPSDLLDTSVIESNCVDSVLISNGTSDVQTDGDVKSGQVTEQNIEPSMAGREDRPNAQEVGGKQSRKRGRHQNRHKRVKRKVLRNSGQEYERSDGHIQSGRQLGPACSCRRKCTNKLTEAHCERVFNDFWALGDFSQQNAFLFGQIKSLAPLRRRVQAEYSRRQLTYVLYVKDCNGVDVRVCKQAFLSIFGLNNCRGRVENIISDIAAGKSVPSVDGRGKHGNRPNRTEASVIDDVKNHIQSFPSYCSHYSRKHNINRKYIGADLSIGKMYDLYATQCVETGKKSASRDCYRRIFCNDFNLGFATPKTDTCRTCSAYETLKAASSSDADRSKHETELTVHKSEAAKAFQLLQKDTGIYDESEQLTLAFDLQQALPTPKLNVGPAFYKRKIMTYNVGIHNCGQNTAVMMLWPETVAGRGADEIGSCILKYFNSVTVSSRKLVVYSDNCSGQNKNFTIMSLWLYLINTGKFDEIRHIFPISGHTLLPCDRDFGDIERVLRKHEQIYTPDEYSRIIASARRTNPFTVHQMMRDDFVTFEKIANCTVNRKVTVAGTKVNFRKVTQFKFNKELKCGMCIKYTHDENENWQQVNLQKRGRQYVKYTDVRPIAKNKLDDVTSLLAYVPPVFHAFYSSIVSSTRTTVSNEYLD